MTRGTGASRALIGLAATIALAFALVVMTMMVKRAPSGPELAADQASFLPSGSGEAAAVEDDQVVATLQTASRDYSDELRALLRATRANPDDRALAKQAAERLIAEGRAAGDSRLVGAAVGVLRSFLDDPDAETLYLAATALQYQHDFSGALRLLDEAIGLAPRDAGSILTRATVNTVIGRLDTAMEDCRRLYELQRAELGFLCESAALALTGQAPTVYNRLAEVVARPDALGAALRGYALSLMGEVAALQGRPELARAHFAAVLAENPRELRTRMLLADVLIADNAPGEALNLLKEAPEVDGVLIRRATAAERLGQTETAEAAKEELARRFRQNLDLGLTAHAREETRFFLELAPDPDLALSRARVNWDLQREIEDAQLLIDAAMAAGEPEAAAPVLDWMAEQEISVPALRIPDAVREAAQ